MVREPNHLHDLIGLIHDAPITPDGWRICLAAIISEFDASGAQLTCHAFRPDEFHFHVSVGPFHRRHESSVFQCPNNDGRHAHTSKNDPIGPTTILVKTTREQMAFLRIHFRAADSSPTPNQNRVLELLIPHFRQSLEVQERLATVNTSILRAASALNCFRIGMVLFDQTLKLVFANSSAMRSLNRSSVLNIRRGHLEIHSPRFHSLVKRVIHRGTQTLASGDESVVEYCRILEPDRGHYLECRLVIPHVASTRGAAARPTVLLYLSDDLEKPEHIEGILVSLYKLTPTEAQVAKLLVQGLTPKEICRRLLVKSNTVKLHLRNVLRKTGTHSQTEAISAIMHSPAGQLTYFPQWALHGACALASNPGQLIE